MPTQGNKLRLKEMLSLSLRTFRTKPQRAFLTIMGMAVGIATVLLLISLGYGLQYILIGKLITTQDSLITMEVSYPTESNIVMKRSLIDNLKILLIVGSESNSIYFVVLKFPESGA